MDYTSGEFHAGYQQAIDDVLGLIIDHSAFYPISDYEQNWLNACYAVEESVMNLQSQRK